MKMNEVTNAEDQLALLRLIIDNTWTAIKQQADAQAKQKANKKIPKPRSARLATAKPAPLPKPIAKQAPVKPPSTTPATNPSRSPAIQLTPTEREELARNTAIQMGLTDQKN